MRALFGTQFYPTPDSLIKRMLNCIPDVRLVGSVLEPSAGAGDLADALRRRLDGSYHKVDLDTIEVDPDLAALLAGKGHRVVWDDFLTFSTLKRYDLIVMNPPFANGASHLAKALDLQVRHGGVTICLLNAETLRNPYSRERQELAQRLDNLDANVEVLTGAFGDADRKTDVEVALVTAVTPKPDQTDFIRAEFRKARQRHSVTPGALRHDELVAGSVIEDMIADFDLESETGANLIDQWEAASSLLTREYGAPLLNLQIGSSDATTNGFLRDVRRKYWAKLFGHPSLTAKLTLQMREELSRRIDEFADYDFNLHNIQTLQIAVIGGLNQGVESEAISVFDTLSQKHAMDRFSKNTHYYNGWKTNDSWKVNGRVIIPTHIGYFSSFSSGPGQVLADIEQVLNFFDAMAPIEQNAESRMRAAGRVGSIVDSFPYGKKLEFHYFDAAIYRKGTIHISFRCPELVKRLNIFAGKHYNMLPPNYGAKAYVDLDVAEKATVDAFEGEASYLETRLQLGAARPQLALAM